MFGDDPLAAKSMYERNEGVHAGNKQTTKGEDFIRRSDNWKILIALQTARIRMRRED
jgi:hypothetical protein